LPGEIDREKAIIEKVHALTKERHLDWSDLSREPGHTARFEGMEVIVRNIGHPASDRSAKDTLQIVLIREGTGKRFDPRRTHQIDPLAWRGEPAEAVNSYWQKIAEVLHMSTRQINGTDEIVDEFLGTGGKA
jgi:hypothetical protein